MSYAEVPDTGWRDRLASWRLVIGIAWRADRKFSSLALALSTTSFIWHPTFAIGIGRFTDGAVAGDRGAALVGIGWIVGASALGAISGIFGFPIRMVVRERATHQLDIELIELTAGIATIEHLERPDYADRVEALRSQRLILASAFDAVCMNIGVAIGLFASLGVLVRLDGWMLALPLFGLPSVVFSTRMAARNEAVTEATAPHLRMFRRLFEIAVSPVAGKELRVFGSDRAIEAEHARRSGLYEKAWLVALRRNTVESTIGHVLFTAGFVCSIGLLVLGASDGSVTTGEVAAAITLAATVQGQIGHMVDMAGWLRGSSETARRFGWLTAHARADAERRAPVDPAPIPSRIERAIELDHVTFRYPGTDVDVLSDVSISIPAGSIVAVVGDNGAGKSTLVKLLARCYEPTEGAIRLDGVDLRRFEPSDWRAALSAGFQDYAKFEFTAGHSVGLGLLDHLDDDDSVATALQRAAAAEVVPGLPDGLRTQVGRRFADGHELSGGQWQKLALGRAMMRQDPLLLLLDEPTAALDAEAEHDLFDRYSAAARATGALTGAITILVSHRFSTVRAADLIVVMDGRSVAEVGSHEELMRAGGLYAELFEMQASNYR